MPTVEELQEKIKSLQADVKRYVKTGRQAEAEVKWEEVQRLQRKLEKEEAKLPTHPALEFGPIAQTVAAMAAISLGMSVSPLPYEMYAFYRLFSTITTLAVLCLVVRSGIVWIEYNSIISALPPLATKEEWKAATFDDWLRDFTTKARPDEWQHTRSHPSHFLTTRHAPPRLFPFPLGKTRPDATVADELWWEGGNAPHVGHFNKPQAGVSSYPAGVLADKLMERGKKKIEIWDQQDMWKKRIRSIQMLALVAILSFVSRKAAVVGLVYLIYTTLSSEIDTMLRPPRSLDSLEATKLEVEMLRNQEPPKSRSGLAQGVQGMGYVYQPETVGANHSDSNVAIPMVTVAPHVLMTSDCSYLTGFGEKIKGDNQRLD